MVRAINKARPVMVSRAQLRSLIFEEFLVNMGATEGEIRAAREAVANEQLPASNNAVVLNQTTEMKE